MASCAICGKDIGVFDSSTSYVDDRGSRVEVHTACKTAQQSQGMFSTDMDPTFYVPATEPAGTTPASAPAEDKALGIPRVAWYVGGAVVALAVVGGIVAWAVRR